MKKFLSLILIVILVFALCACQNSSTEKKSEEVIATPEATPVPTPSPTSEPTYIIDGKELTESQLKEGYTFELFGQQVNTKTTERLEYLKQPEIGDAGLEKFREVLPYMYNLKYLSFDRCETTDEAMEKLRDDFPDIEIVWRIYFGPFSCMTDVETIWASCDLRNETCEPLKYCTKVKNLDIGHNAMNNLDFLYYMPDLEMLIISCSEFDDLTAVGSCKNLKILEAYDDWYDDLSPIAGCESLEYLNIGNNQPLTDFSALYGLKNLKILKANSIYNYEFDHDAEEAKIAELMPDCEVDFSWCGDGLNNTWRYTSGYFTGNYTELYTYIRETFGYDDPLGSTRLYE